MDWLRWHHGTVESGRWRAVARRSGQPVHAVVAVWALLSECASRARERGNAEGWDDESAGAALDMDGETVAAIREAMQGRALDGLRLIPWEEEQVKREREDKSVDRVRAFRERQRQETPEKPKSRRVTPRNAKKRTDREIEESRREERDHTSEDKEIILPPEGNGNGTPPADADASDRMKANQLLGAWVNRQRRMLGKPDYMPSEGERGRFGAAAKRICAAHPADEVVAAFHGMDSMWPHAPPKGEPWTLETMEKKFAAALGASMNHPDVVAAREASEMANMLEGL